jgi:sulfate adenylyltransferase
MISPYCSSLLVNCIDTTFDIKELPALEISESNLLEFEHIAYGSYTPLDRFPLPFEIDSIYRNWSLLDGTTFPIPPLFTVDKNEYNRFDVGDSICLTFKNSIVGVLFLEAKIPFNKKEYLDSIFQTRDPTHPGVSFISSLPDFLFSGKIVKLSKHSNFFTDSVYTPQSARDLFKEKKFNTVTAFSTTNIPHRAHEHLILQGFESSDAVLVHALDIFGKRAKFSSQQIKDAYNTLVTLYPNNNIIFTTLPMLPRSAGPRSSLMQGIIRQNFGCSSQIIGRDHEGYKNTYGLYDSQEIFSKYPIDLTPLLLPGPYYCSSCNCVTDSRSCSHDGDLIEEISGSRIRSFLARGDTVPEYIIRPDILDIL